MIPTPDSLTPGWFAEQLQRSGFDKAGVVGFDSCPVGTGQIGKCVKFDLTYTGDAGDAPGSLIGKFPSDDATSRQTGVALRNYYREVRFYQLVADRLTIRTPRCYYADIVDEGPEFMLLLEDMAPARQGDQLSGCDPAVADAAVQQLVGLQVPSWCDATFKAYDWLHDPRPQENTNPHELYQQMLPGFVDRYGDRLNADQVAILSKVAESPGCPIFQPPGERFCLEHVDYRLDNMLIKPGTDTEIAVVDWQSIKVGKPLNDVGYFLGAGLVPAVRREVEPGIVRRYHASLLANGVDGFDWAECWEAYRKAAFAGFAVTVIASMIVGQTERGDRMFVTMADRHSRHALDLGADEFL